MQGLRKMGEVRAELGYLVNVRKLDDCGALHEELESCEKIAVLEEPHHLLWYRNILCSSLAEHQHQRHAL